MKNNSIKTVVAVGIGAALFFVLGRFVAIPSPVPNTNISLQYAVLALLAAMYGPVAGGLIGFIGHALIDLSWGGSPWWSWVITSAFVGVVIGLFAKKLNVQEGVFDKTKTAIFAIANVAAHVIGWVRRACKKGICAGRICCNLQYHHRCDCWRTVNCGIYKDHCKERFSRQRIKL